MFWSFEKSKVGAVAAQLACGGCQSSKASYRVVVTKEPAPQWPEDPALFLDLDGTLLEFALDPAAVEVSARVRKILERLPEAMDHAVAIVSGRTLDSLDRLLGEGRFPLAALHGLHRRDASGRVWIAGPVGEDLGRVRELMQELAEEFPGAMLEDKGATQAFHYRRCPQFESAIAQRITSAVHAIAPELEVLRGNMVIEVRPAHSNKGTAIEAFMQEQPFAGRTPVFIGDDVTDEDGFAVINRLRGVSIKVGPGSTCARYRLSGIDAVVDWLDDFVATSRA